MKQAIALGTFDGLHEGHRAVLDHPDGYKLTVITFDIPPKSYFSDDKALLMTLDDRKEGLKNLGADEIIVLDFDKVRKIKAEDFLEFLRKEFSPDLILCGFNYRFGKDATGDTGLISEFCEKNGIAFSVSPPVKTDGSPVSSTLIRNLVSSGDIESANRYIYGGFGFTSTVLHGDKRGKTMGFPTVNQSFPEELVKPKFGVYVGKIIIAGKAYKCITNIGLRPTFKTEKVTCESYVFDFSDEIYGESVTLKPLKFLREEIKFDGLQSLIKAIKEDIKTAEKFSIN